MGKGDIKTRRGKLFRGTYGRLRRRKKTRKSSFEMGTKGTKSGQVKTTVDDKTKEQVEIIEKEPEKVAVEEEPKKEPEKVAVEEEVKKEPEKPAAEEEVKKEPEKAVAKEEAKKEPEKKPKAKAKASPSAKTKKKTQEKKQSEK